MNVTAVVEFFRARPRLIKAIQFALLAITVGFCAWAVRDQWSKARPLLENVDAAYLTLAFVIVGVYYLVFILGWIRILEAWGIPVGYRPALQAEMVSMLAKYLPGALWTPAARTIALRRYAGVTETATVLASILVEAGLSAISGVIVFVVSLAWVRDVNAPLPALIAFALLLTALLHPRVFRPLANKLLKPFGAGSIEPLPFPFMLGLLAFYCGTWLIGGFAVYFMLRSVGAEVGLATIPYLGGVSAVGAIVSVLAFFAPSGIGAREASMYGLLLAVTTTGPALSVTLLNRLAITLVEVLLFFAGLVGWRITRSRRA
ncbi:MAG: lysylphosphatidylglycerol synthase domain-containing protein [Gaiellaceae bacterium]